MHPTFVSNRAPTFVNPTLQRGLQSGHADTDNDGVKWLTETVTTVGLRGRP